MIWLRKKPKADADKTHHKKHLPVIPMNIKQVKRAVREFENQLPKGIDRTVLLGKDHRIDFTLLAPFLDGVPDKPFYMSKETYEIFSEEEADTARYMDEVQRAVDFYIDEKGAMPLVENDPNRKISYYLLERGMFLKQRPPMDFYMTRYDHLISDRPQP